LIKNKRPRNAEYHLKPNENNPVAITVLDHKIRTIGWSPGLKKSVYIDDSTEPETIKELKRIREAYIVIAYDQLNDRILYIELNEQEHELFDKIYASYLEVGGLILFNRTREGRRMRVEFVLDKGSGISKAIDVPEKKILFASTSN
jgi:hypothetical protein